MIPENVPEFGADSDFLITLNFESSVEPCPYFSGISIQLGEWQGIGIWDFLQSLF